MNTIQHVGNDGIVYVTKALWFVGHGTERRDEHGQQSDNFTNSWPETDEADAFE